MHRYLINQLSNHIRGVLTLLVFFTSTIGHSQSLFETLQESFKKDVENYPKLLQKHLNKNFKLSNVESEEDIKLHPSFMSNLVFNNKNETLVLALTDECSLIDLLGTELLYSSTGKLQYVIIDVKNKAGSREIHTLPKEEYLNLIGYKKCPKSKQLKTYFTFSNIRKTLSREKILFPKSKTECLETHKNFVTDVKSPYLCEIAKKISDLDQKKINLKNLSKSNFRKYQELSQQVEEGETFQKIINPSALSFLTNMCTFSYSGTKYCEDVFSETYWSNSIKGLVSQAPLDGFCRAYLKKESLKKSDLEFCANSFAGNPKLCTNIIKSSDALIPTPDCKQLSKALNFSRLYKDYQDCPVRVGHSSLVTASRVISHFNKNILSDGSDCELNSIFPYAKFNQDFLESELWQLNLCYEDKIYRKKTCLPTLLSEFSDSTLSLSYTMGKTLLRLRGFNDKDRQCRVITEEEYKPTLLEFKSGCYVIKSATNCTAVDCKLKVMLDDQEFDNYTIESSLQFDLFPYRFTEANKSLLNLVEKHYKKTFKKVLNISSLKRVFESKKDAIIMATGCFEDLLPSMKQSSLLNECTIMPFIVDGIIEHDSSHSLVTRTSLDYIHAPRIIPWADVFASVKNYQRFHPLNQWSFYALY